MIEVAVFVNLAE
jgi:hypothetical protein